jgi:hypothetical protein
MSEIEREDELPEVEEVVEVEAPVEQPDPEIESEAKRYGWKPKESFTLAPDGWVDASRFMELPSTQVKVLRDTNRELAKQRAELDERLSRIDQTTSQALQRVRDQERRQYDAALARVRADQQKAVESADTEAYTKARQNEAALLQAMPQDTGPADVVKSYMESDKGSWMKDQELMAFAVQAIDDAPGVRALSPQRQIEWAERHVRSNFPDRFPQAQSAPVAAAQPVQRVSKVDGGGLATRGREKGADDLPPEAKQVGSKFVKDGLYSNLQEYARDYFSQSGV